MDTIRTSSKGQIVIPKAIRESLDIRSGTELDVELIPGEGFKVTRRDVNHGARVGSLAGSLGSATSSGKKNRYARLSDDQGVALAVQEDDNRVKAYSLNSKRARR